MLALIRLQSADDLRGAGGLVLEVLASRAGFVRGSLGRTTDDPQRWVLLTEWDSVGAYRRAISAHEVRIVGADLFAVAEDEPAAYEVFIDVVPAPAALNRRVAGSSDRTEQ